VIGRNVENDSIWGDDGEIGKRQRQENNSNMRTHACQHTKGARGQSYVVGGSDEPWHSIVRELSWLARDLANEQLS